jgi:ribosomal protein L13E
VTPRLQTVQLSTQTPSTPRSTPAALKGHLSSARETTSQSSVVQTKCETRPGPAEDDEEPKSRPGFVVRKGFDDEIALDANASVVLWFVVVVLMLLMIGLPAAFYVRHRALVQDFISAQFVGSCAILALYALVLLQLGVCVPYLFVKVLAWQQVNSFRRLPEPITDLEAAHPSARKSSRVFEPTAQISPRTRIRRQALSRLLKEYGLGMFSTTCRFSAKHLKAICQEYSFGDFKSLGYTVNTLEGLGLGVTPNGLQVRNLRGLNYTAEELRAAAFLSSELRHLGFTAAELRAAGADASELKKAGYQLSDLRNAHITAAELLTLKVTYSELKRVGFSAAALLSAHAPLTSLKSLGYSVAEVAAADVDISGLHRAGYSAAECVRALFTLGQLRSGGFTASELREAALCPPEELRKAGYTLDDLRQARYTLQQLHKCAFSVDDLRSSADGPCGPLDPIELALTGHAADTLKAAGFTLEQIVGAKDRTPAHIQQLSRIGVSCTELHTAGCSANELKAAGMSAQEIWKAGYTLPELRKCGMTARELHDVGLTAGELYSIGFTANDLRSGGLSVLKLKQAGILLNELKKAGYSVKELKAAGFRADELRAAGFTCKGMREGGFLAKELKDQGIYASELKQGGFSREELLQGGFSQEILASVGFPAPPEGQANIASQEKPLVPGSFDVDAPAAASGVPAITESVMVSTSSRRSPNESKIISSWVGIPMFESNRSSSSNA